MYGSKSYLFKAFQINSHIPQPSSCKLLALFHRLTTHLGRDASQAVKIHRNHQSSHWKLWGTLDSREALSTHTVVISKPRDQSHCLMTNLCRESKLTKTPGTSLWELKTLRSSQKGREQLSPSLNPLPFLYFQKPQKRHTHTHTHAHPTAI